MGKDETLVTNFVTVTKRMPLKARLVLALSMIVVIFELVSGYIQLNAEESNRPKIMAPKQFPELLVKSRERKEVNEDILKYAQDLDYLILNNPFYAGRYNRNYLERNKRDEPNLMHTPHEDLNKKRTKKIVSMQANGTNSLSKHNKHEP